MLSQKQFKDIDVGDAFEVGTIFENLTEEPMLWTCIGVKVIDKEIIKVFEVSYLGVPVNEYNSFVKDEKVQFVEVGL